ncbi:MAG TPA: ABC transporter permease [Thermoplasmata archaeon]|nr:ABC transporter permease [Thermoplasmata archaeon]
MTRPGYGEPHVDLGELEAPRLVRRLGRLLRYLRRYATKTWALVVMEAQKLRHDPTELLTRMVQPALWLVVFGEVFTRANMINTGPYPYVDYITPGILSQSVLFVAIFYGIAAIWERDLGILHKFMATPTPRTALVLGKALSAGLRGLSQVVVILLLAMLLGVQLTWTPLALGGILAVVILGACLFATLSLVIASLVKTRERFMGIGQLLTMPLFFASNAIYPLSLMPPALQAVAAWNPMTYMVDAARTLMLPGYPSVFGLGLDFAVLVGCVAGLVLVGGRCYEGLVR